jgi:hypothetical protein
LAESDPHYTRMKLEWKKQEIWPQYVQLPLHQAVLKQAL